MRSLWINRINAASRLHGTAYSRFMNNLVVSDVRRILFFLAAHDSCGVTCDAHSSALPACRTVRPGTGGSQLALCVSTRGRVSRDQTHPILSWRLGICRYNSIAKCSPSSRFTNPNLSGRWCLSRSSGLQTSGQSQGSWLCSIEPGDFDAFKSHTHAHTHTSRTSRTLTHLPMSHHLSHSTPVSEERCETHRPTTHIHVSWIPEMVFDLVLVRSFVLDRRSPLSEPQKYRSTVV